VERLLLIATVVGLGCEGGLERLEPAESALAFAIAGADAGEGAGCDLVDDWGCGPTEKCAPDTRTRGGAQGICVAEGTVGLGGACCVDESSGADDCARGLRCADDVCKEVCRVAPDSCPAERYCAPIEGRLGEAGVGVCELACDLFAQDCDGGESCFLAVGERGFATMCAPAFPEPPPSDSGCGVPGASAAGVAGDCCSYVNTCATGYACVQARENETRGEGVCAYLCDPTGALPGAPRACDPPGPGPAPTYVCVPLREQTALDLPATIGVCIEREKARG